MTTRTIIRSAQCAAGALLLSLLFAPQAAAQPLFVDWDGSIWPADATLPWTSYGDVGSSWSITDGIMTMVDGSGEAGALEFYRTEPRMLSWWYGHFEVRVGHVTNNGAFCDPCIVLVASDSVLAYQPEEHSYALSFYSDHIDLRVHEYTGEDRIALSIPVPDLAATYHVVRLDMIGEDIVCGVAVYLDGRYVGAADGFCYPWLNTVVFGHRSSAGTGTSQWDYVRYWGDSGTPSTQPSWGQVKAKYAPPAVKP